jgi:hypothetical protein
MTANSRERLDPELVKNMFEADTIHRIDSASGRHCSIDTIVQRVEDWKAEGSIVVMTAGVFDALHLNHMLALHHFRYIGAAAILGDTSGDKTASNRPLNDIAASEKVRLVVSSDTDARVSHAKSRQAKKGGAPKPLLSWTTRSLTLAKQYIQGPEDGASRPLVDLITRHGSDTCMAQKCPHDDNITIAEAIQPDRLIITSTSVDSIEMARASKLPEERIHIVDENDLAYYDNVLEADVSTSALIMRARS